MTKQTTPAKAPGLTEAELDTEPPRLQTQMNRLVRMLASSARRSVLAVALYGTLRGYWLDALLGGIALGMSMLPAEFPVATGPRAVLKPKEAHMKRYVRSSLAALTLCAIGLSAQAASGETMGPPAMEQMQRWAADHEAILDAELAGLKAGIKLNADQEKLWPPFEAAVRDAAKSRMKQMMEMATRMQDMPEMKRDQEEPSGMGMNSAASPVNRVDALAQRLSERAAGLKKVADSAKPLYASLDESQKRLFGMLGGDLLMMGHGHRGMGMMGGGAGEMMGGDGMRGMGMMPNMMGHGMMGPPSHNDEGSSDDE